MAENSDEILVTVDDDTGGEGSGPTDAVADLKSQFETLKAQTEAERQRSARLQAELQRRDQALINSGAAELEADLRASTAEYAAAAEQGDFQKQAEIQRKIARDEARLQTLEEAKHNVRQVPPADPIETFIASRDAGTQAWLRAHPDETRALILDPNSKRAKKLTAAHTDAIAEGYAEGSSDYFRHIESFTGMRSAEPSTGGERQRRSSPPAAPVSYAGGVNSNGGGMRVSLTKGEAASATDGTLTWNPGDRHPKTGERIMPGDPLVGEPIGTSEFGRRKLALQRSGAYNRGSD